MYMYFDVASSFQQNVQGYSTDLLCKLIDLSLNDITLRRETKKTAQSIPHPVPVYHVEKPRPFFSPLTLYGHVMRFFKELYGIFLKFCKFSWKIR